jgi:plastocyanin
VTPVTTLGAGSIVWSRRRFLLALPAVGLARSARAEGVMIEIRQFKFAPAEIEIAAGTTVTFVNLDLVPHTATGEEFDTGTLKQDDRREIKFPVTGEFAYLCKFHRHMTGRILVR